MVRFEGRVDFVVDPLARQERLGASGACHASSRWRALATGRAGADAVGRRADAGLTEIAQGE